MYTRWKSPLAYLEHLEPLLVRQLEHVGTAQNETRRVLGDATLLLNLDWTPIDEVVE